MDWPLRADFYHKIPYFHDFGGLKPTFLKLQWKNLARGGTWDSYPTPKFLKITQGDSSLMGKFLQNNQIFFAILSYLSPHFYTI